MIPYFAFSMHVFVDWLQRHYQRLPFLLNRNCSELSLPMIGNLFLNHKVCFQERAVLADTKLQLRVATYAYFQILSCLINLYSSFNQILIITWCHVPKTLQTCHIHPSDDFVTVNLWPWPTKWSYHKCTLQLVPLKWSKCTI